MTDDNHGNTIKDFFSLHGEKKLKNDSNILMRIFVAVSLDYGTSTFSLK